MPNTLPSRQELRFQGKDTHISVIDFVKQEVSIRKEGSKDSVYPMKLIMHLGAMIIARVEADLDV